MAVWPDNFCPLINSFQETPPENTIRTSMDVGPDKVRRRTTANVRPVSFNLFLLPPDVLVMDDFFVNQTRSGSEAFDFVHPRTKQPVQARFVSSPSYKNRSTGYEVSVSLEILP